VPCGKQTKAEPAPTHLGKLQERGQLKCEEDNSSNQGQILQYKWLTKMQAPKSGVSRHGRASGLHLPVVCSGRIAGSRPTV
jgi:hypothetical protein